MVSGQRHVFFVDDDVSVRKVVKRTLEQLEVHVTCFRSGHDCLAQLEEQSCDLLITDIKMPDMGGLDLLSQVKSLAPWIPVLIVTGFGDIPTAVKAVKMGAADFIEKPLDREGFLTLVNSLLDYASHWTELIGKPLTKTELKILHYVLQGKSSKEVSNYVHRSLRTVELHRQHIMRKFGVDNAVELMRVVTERGLKLPKIVFDASV